MVKLISFLISLRASRWLINSSASISVVFTSQSLLYCFHICTLVNEVNYFFRVAWCHPLRKKTRFDYLSRHHAGYSFEVGNTQAIIGHRKVDEKALVKPQWYGWTIDANQEVHSVGSGRYAYSTWKSQAKIPNNEEMLRLINLREAISFRVRMWCVVAMRLQGQHPSFQLHTSSNTSSLPMNVEHGSFRRFREGNVSSILKLLS
jgi:hypothetical protein